ncbi:MAG: hypothetical protein EOM50_11270 [Erysipelotrichia bacterium]|nr:hypothetical protein [Erysipelotrichia bacterium]NCC54220.1 hypothetical protein [Erysipelotrichia bacterium]
MVEETLQSEFQIEIVDMIPSYKLHLYPFTQAIDCVITAMRIEIGLSKLLIYINPFLQEEDYLKISKAGISRKKLLSNYFGIYSRLDFSSYHDREKVMKVMQEELGYSNVRNHKNVLSLTDILRMDSIQVLNGIDLEVMQNEYLSLFHLEQCADITLMNDEFEEYQSVWMDEEELLIHNSESTHITKTKMAMIVLKQGYSYKQRKIRVLILCVSKEQLENVLAIKQFSKLCMRTNFM